MGGFGQKEGGGVARGRGEGNVWGEEENDEEGRVARRMGGVLGVSGFTK